MVRQLQQRGQGAARRVLEYDPRLLIDHRHAEERADVRVAQAAPRRHLRREGFEAREVAPEHLDNDGLLTPRAIEDVARSALRDELAYL